MECQIITCLCRLYDRYTVVSVRESEWIAYYGFNCLMFQYVVQKPLIIGRRHLDKVYLSIPKGRKWVEFIRLGKSWIYRLIRQIATNAVSAFFFYVELIKPRCRRI